jgi:hypothetical protein
LCAPPGRATSSTGAIIARYSPGVLDIDRRGRASWLALHANQRRARGCARVSRLDGHHFYDRTPEQAERDRARDRRLLADGWITIRFTGREVVRNPMACAREAVGLFDRLRARRGGPGRGKPSSTRRGWRARRLVGGIERETDDPSMALEAPDRAIVARNGHRC